MEILIANNVVKKFGEKIASDNVSFGVEEGKIFGFLGPNGAGKTTLIRMITNIYKPDSGIITLFGDEISSKHQNNIGYLPEERGLYKKVKVIDQLKYFGSLKNLSSKDAERAALDWMVRMEATDMKNKKVQELSKGMAQKIQFISTVMHNPDFLILDEPFSGFDPINATLLKNIILELKEKGKTIVLSTHVMHQVEELCDDIILINNGSKVLEGNVREIKKSFGRNNLLIEFSGDSKIFDEMESIKILNKTSNRVELKLLDKDINQNELISALLSNIEIHKFEFSEPSLHEIFVETVNRSN